MDLQMSVNVSAVDLWRILWVRKLALLHGLLMGELT